MANDAPSTSAPLQQFIVKVGSTDHPDLLFGRDRLGSRTGGDVHRQATPATGTGSVQFLDGTAVLRAPGPSAAGPHRSRSTTLAAGPHSITAVYSGDANTNGSTSAVLTQTVKQGASSVALTSSVNPSTFGQAVTLTAKLTPATATTGACNSWMARLLWERR